MNIMEWFTENEAAQIFAKINGTSIPDAGRIIVSFSRGMTQPLTKNDLIGCISSWRECTQAIIINAVLPGRDS